MAAAMRKPQARNRRWESSGKIVDAGFSFLGIFKWQHCMLPRCITRS